MTEPTLPPWPFVVLTSDHTTQITPDPGEQPWTWHPDGPEAHQETP